MTSADAPARAGRRRYQVQAAIALLHGSAPSEPDTDWPQIAALYATLARLAPAPAVTLARAIALGRAGEPEAGLRLLDGEARLGDPLAHAARAELLVRAARPGEAADSLRRALARTPAGSAEASDLRALLAALPGAATQRA